MNTINALRKMAVKARIFACLFLICIFLPSLASAFVDHLPEVTQANDNNDVPIHVNSVAHLSHKKVNGASKVKAHALKDRQKKHPKPNHNPTPNPVPVDPTPDPVPVDPTPDPVPVDPTPDPVPVDPTPDPVPVHPTPDPVPVDPTPDPVPVHPTPDPVPVDPTPDPVPVDPTPDPVPVDPTPDPVPVDPTPDPVPVDPTPDPVPVDPTPDPVPVDPTPDPVPVDPTPNPVPVDPTPNPVPVDPTPNPVPVDPTPNPVPVDPTPNPVPVGYPGATQAPVTIGYGGAPITPYPSDQQTGAVQNHPTPKEIKEHRKRAGLQVGFYHETCPNAEKIINDGMTRAFGNDSNTAAPIPRLLFHDCFVNGCDASLFLDQTPSGARVEKLANSNGPTIRGFDLIDEIKAKLEAECPGIVSCADLLAYLARDAFVVSGVPHYDVPGGRRDGMESLEANVFGNLPLPDFTVDKMIDLFKKKGMSEEDLVVLIGAHSIGAAHCFSFRYRVDDPQKATMVDPRLAGVMKFTCTSPTSTLAFDSTTQYKMDSIYYKQLMEKRGLLESDMLLSEDPRTKDFIQKFGANEKGWFNKLGKAMNKLASIQVLTGDQGQIRKQCRSVN